MPLDITGREKTVYEEGDCVSFDIDGTNKGEGIIRGLSMNNVIDFWIVEITSGSVDKKVYPYSCATMPHVCLKPIPKKVSTGIGAVHV